MSRSPLWVVSLALFGVISLWSIAGTIEVPNANARGELLVLLVLSVIAHVIGLAQGLRAIRTLGLIGFATAFFAGQVLYSTIDLAPSLGYVTLLVAYVEFLQITERFVPLFGHPHLPETRSRIRGALLRAFLRLGVAAAVAFLVSLMAADLAGSGTVSATSIPSALFLAIAFLVVVWLLAILPVLERRNA